MACGWYRTEDGQGTIHVHWSRGKGNPSSCVGPRLDSDDPKIGVRCGRMSVALCDYPAGTLNGKPVTCDAPLCGRHRTHVGANRDHCPIHATRGQQQLELT